MRVRSPKFYIGNNRTVLTHLRDRYCAVHLSPLSNPHPPYKTHRFLHRFFTVSSVYDADFITKVTVSDTGCDTGWMSFVPANVAVAGEFTYALHTHDIVEQAQRLVHSLFPDLDLMALVRPDAIETEIGRADEEDVEGDLVQSALLVIERDNQQQQLREQDGKKMIGEAEELVEQKTVEEST